MKTPRDRMRVWRFLAVVAVAAAMVPMLSLRPVGPQAAWAGALCAMAPDCGVITAGSYTCADGRHVTSSLDCNDLCQMEGTDGVLCATFDDNLCLEVLCGAGACGDGPAIVPSSCDDHDDCTMDSCDPCANNCAGACGHREDLTIKGCTLCGSDSSCEVPNGPVVCADGTHAALLQDCNGVCVTLNVDDPCATFDSNLCLEAVCGAAGECGSPRRYVPPSCNDHNDCTIDSCDACTDSCGGACVHQPDLNASGCNLAPGAMCTAGSQCALTFCVDGVCCNRACTAPNETCNLPGSVGECVALAPAPVVSGRGILIVGLLLTAMGFWGMRRAMRRPRR